MKARRDVYALFAHGIGTQDAHFADYAQRTLSAALSRQGVALYARSVHYAPVFNMAADAFLKDAEAHGTDAHLSTKLVTHTLADAIQYLNSKELRDRVASVFDTACLSLRAPDDLVIFAHSLGCLAAVDWLRTRVRVQNVRFFTMGCNIGLLTMGTKWAAPSQIADPGVWTNIWDEDDMLGFPVSGRAETAHVKDVEVSVGKWRGGGTGLAHIMYLEDRDLWSKTVPALVLGR